MKIKYLSCLLVLLLALPLIAAPPKGRLADPGALNVDNGTFIDVNRILMFVTNHANFGRDLSGRFGYDYGTFFPFTSIGAIDDGSNTVSPYYAGGLWIGGIDAATGDTLVVVSEYSSEYVPGPMVNETFSPDDAAYKVYKLYRDSLAGNPNADYTNWPIDQGAPTNDDDTPAMFGDQMLWSVFNDADVVQHDNNNGSTDPLGIEIKQTVFGFDREGALGNMVFLKIQVFNKGGKDLTDCYFSLWSDPDLGSAGDDFVGCDTLLGLGFCYNDNDVDTKYGVPPAMGIDFFQGPLISTGEDADTAFMWGDTLAGYVNMGMTSFNKYINGTDPDDNVQTYWFMEGLDAKNGGVPYSDGLAYRVPGDPNDPGEDPAFLDIASADRRMMQTTGPIDFLAGDSTEIIAAFIVGQGGDKLQSVSVVKALDDFAQKLYPEFNPPAAPAKPVVTVAQNSRVVTLSWTDTSEVDPGEYEFEGYTVWEGASDAGPWIELQTWDVVNGRDSALIDTVTDSYSQTSQPVVRRALSESGLNYHYTVGGLSDIQTYYYRVSAFSFSDTLLDGSDVPNGDRFLESATVVAVIPQSPGAGVVTAFDATEMIPVTHTGPGDGSIQPVVIDPQALTGHTYQVTFETGVFGTVWHLVNTTTGDTLLANQVNQSGDDEYFVVDGVLVKVLGPDPGVKTSDMFATDDQSLWGWDIPEGTRRFTWANADGFGWEGFRGAIGWGGPGDSHGFGENDPVDPGLLPDVLLKLATVDTLGVFDPLDTNVSYAYRYGRGFTGAPAQPEFAPFMINTVDGGYRYQDFEPSCPLSAWDMSVDPPRRLVVGYLENNAEFAVLDGKWWVRSNGDYGEGGPAAGSSATAGDGPREWLWIYLDDYSETPDPAYQGEAIGDPMPIMYWLTVNRRGNVPFSPDSTGQDQFLIISAKVNTATDVFTFTASSSTMAENEAALDDIKAVPNPFYLFGPYDPVVGNYQIKFHHLPATCTITIYNLSGDLINVIEKDDASTAIATWNVQTQENLPVASGIYIYVVDAPGFGTKIGKMAVFTEDEVLEVF